MVPLIVFLICMVRYYLLKLVWIRRAHHERFIISARPEQVEGNEQIIKFSRAERPRKPWRRDLYRGVQI